ncbi:helix-turn-helix domain-containing protein [Cryobacterium adonitolivorans]|uniref:Helix-turn-helix domain-containing protein n=1 Tax=Cryobacterium adonitolivorans TaxID=1259189 RepID=A0A4V3ICH8_9MICO|nr:helix-turn-helix transcriptional regulator [Cryobacterium adonitolivorans]TFC01034.1 helix-turn-helix domain-containing protein [Cryobacterium adonitolivorans]
MDDNTVGNFLRARRQMVHPGQVGLAVDDGRRVLGLRREEVAMLAGISSDYYLRLEQGRDSHPSDQVLKALARALLLDDEATIYLQRLVTPVPERVFAPSVGSLDEEVFDFLGSWDHTAAYVLNGCLDVLACNLLASRLLPDAIYPGGSMLDQIFSDSAKAFLPNWEDEVVRALASMRERTDPNDPRLHEVVGKFMLREPEFARLWARHDVGTFSNGAGSYYIAEHGLVRLSWQNLAVPSDPRLMLVATFAVPGTPEDDALRSLAA